MVGAFGDDTMGRDLFRSESKLGPCNGTIMTLQLRHYAVA